MIQNQHEDGSVPQTAQDQLLKASNFYKNKVQRLEWEQPTEQDNKILALAAELKSAIKKKDGKPGGKGKKRVSFQKGKQYSDEDKKAARANKNEPKPDWIVNSVAPTPANIHKYRTWNGAKWYWCHKDTGGKCTGVWRTHHPKKCEGRMLLKPAPAAAGAAAKKKKGKEDSPGLKLIKANQSILKKRAAEQAMEIDEEEEEEDDSYMDAEEE